MSTEFKMEDDIEKNEVKEPVKGESNKKAPTATIVNLVIIGIAVIVCMFWLGFCCGVQSTGGYDPTEIKGSVETTEATEATEETVPETTEETIPETTEETVPETTEAAVKPTEPKPSTSNPKPSTPAPTEPNDIPTSTPVTNLTKKPETDRELLACVIYQEAGWDKSCDECRRRVADVVLNRVAHEHFPNTILGVLTQKSQYGRYYWTGVVWPSRASSASERHAVERAYRIADEVLAGQHSELYGNGYIWQAEFRQGTSQVYHCGTYFGR